MKLERTLFWLSLVGAIGSVHYIVVCIEPILKCSLCNANGIKLMQLMLELSLYLLPKLLLLISFFLYFLNRKLMLVSNLAAVCFALAHSFFYYLVLVEISWDRDIDVVVFYVRHLLAITFLAVLVVVTYLNRSEAAPRLGSVGETN